MSLTIEQKEFIITLDSQAKDIIQTSGQEGLLMSLADKIHDIKKVMDALSHDELDQYCEKYDGFYMYMKLLEQLAQGCADGAFKDLLKN